MQVLVVEDECLIRMLVCNLLEDAGYACIEAANAIEALALLDSKLCRPTLLVTDFNLGPGPNGQTLAREAVSRIPGLPVVFMTGNPESFDDYPFCTNERLVAKPFAGSTLVERAAALLPLAHLPRSTEPSLVPARHLQTA